VVARLGGDEFAVILNNCDLDRGITIAQTLVTTVSAQSVSSDVGPMSVGVSIGVTLMEASSGASIDEFIRQADGACYTAKNSGGGVVVHTPVVRT
jgi:diguanylate cyclase (GGDEF)-like protein